MKGLANRLGDAPFEIGVIDQFNLRIHCPIVSDVARMSEARCGSSVEVGPEFASLTRATLVRLPKGESRHILWGLGHKTTFECLRRAFSVGLLSNCFIELYPSNINPLVDIRHVIQNLFSL